MDHLMPRAGARAIAPLLACALCLAQPALAWGPIGHRAVGDIAQALLTPAASAALAQLLAEDRDADGRPTGRRTLAEVSDWADEIRGTAADRPRWHYDNRPVCTPGEEAAPGAGPRAWCAQDECASAQLVRLIATLGARERPAAEREEALKWVVHLVGDLHQPLHAADLAQGGNLIRVARHGRAHGHESLHAYWDFDLVALALHPHDGAMSAAARQRLVQRARAADPALVAAAPERWAQESNELARTVALDLPGVGCSTGAQPRADRAITPDARYVRRARAVVEARIALAGARLARVLNATLGARD